MDNISLKGISCMKYHQIAISDTATELTKDVNNMPVELTELNGEYIHVMNIDIPALGIKETWVVGINKRHNSSEVLEPFDLGIIRISEEEFIIRLSATCNVSDSNEHLLSFELYSKFKAELPNEFLGIDMFYDLI